MFNEVEIDEYEDDEFLSVFLKSFEEPCSERSEVRTITKVRWEIVPKFSSSGKKLVSMNVYPRSRKCISGSHGWLNIEYRSVKYPRKHITFVKLLDIYARLA